VSNHNVEEENAYEVASRWERRLVEPEHKHNGSNLNLGKVKARKEKSRSK
jgi:hypothetical protein